jgi:hypothetical protein
MRHHLVRLNSAGSASRFGVQPLPWRSAHAAYYHDSCFIRRRSRHALHVPFFCSLPSSASRWLRPLEPPARPLPRSPNWRRSSCSRPSRCPSPAPSRSGEPVADTPGRMRPRSSPAGRAAAPHPRAPAQPCSVPGELSTRSSGRDAALPPLQPHLPFRPDPSLPRVRARTADPRRQIAPGNVPVGLTGELPG